MRNPMKFDFTPCISNPFRVECLIDGLNEAHDGSNSSNDFLFSSQNWLYVYFWGGINQTSFPLYGVFGKRKRENGACMILLFSSDLTTM